MGAGANVERSEKVNILMVDDQPGKLLTYEAILSDLDANLIKARSGREGWSSFLSTMLPWFCSMSACRRSMALKWPT